MSTDTANADTNIAPDDPVQAAGTTFQLTATNDSSVAGSRYFSVYPPILTNIPAKSQVLMALVSAPTSQAEPATTMTWQGGSGALNLFAFAGDTSPDTALRVSVALGDTVATDWTNGAFTFTPSAGGPVDGIEVTFTPAVPVGTKIGLIVGPGAILVSPPAGQSPLTLTPDLSLVATVVFGTAYQWPESDVSDVSRPQVVTFRPGATTTGPTASAKIIVGLDNLILEDG